MIQLERLQSIPTTRARRTLAIVSRHPEQHVLDTVLRTEDYDVVLIESLARAYSHIKRLAPQMVIVCLEIDDLEGVQVLSMLNVDNATSHIPVVTYLTTREPDEFGDDQLGIDQESFRLLMAPSIN